MRRLQLTLIGALSIVPIYLAGAEEVRMQYPETRRDDHVDVYHGVEAPDPYRWLEQDVRESPEVADWVRRQNEVTFGYLEAIPERRRIRQRVEELWNYERFSTFFQRGGRYFYFRNDGLQNQSALYAQKSLDDEPRLLLDPNAWSKDGTVALSGLAVSPAARYAAYGVSDAGSDWQKWQVVAVDSGETLGDELRWVKFSGAAWTRDGKGFFYSRFPEPEEGAEYQNLNLNQKVYYHRVGTPQDEDVLVYERPDHPDWMIGASVSSDGRWLVLTMQVGTDDRHRIAVKDLEEPYGAPVEIVSGFDNEYSFIESVGSTLYFQTDLVAPTRRVIAVDMRRPERENWREIIPAAKETLRGVNLVGMQFIAEYLEDAQSLVKLYSPEGRLLEEIELPGVGTAGGFSGRPSDTETFYSFSSFATPPSIYRYDLLTGESTLLRRAEVAFDPSRYVTNQVFFMSKDGTRVPMFLTHRKGVELYGENPTLLYGYGGFNIPLTPSFSIRTVSWLELGGVWATANLRGGGEYGEKWHEAGTKLDKQNVFDDFIAAAEWLIENKFTRREKLAIMGGSNGGLLVGAAITQRPELFGAALPAVGVMDMLRFHKFTAGRFWVDDYGSSDDPDQFRALYAYSPYHNLKNRDSYPPTLITTADTDDRVVPMHSFKFAAELQYRQKGPAPPLIRIETSAGHGAGKPTSKAIEELADEWAFLVKSLQMELPPEEGKQ